MADHEKVDTSLDYDYYVIMCFPTTFQSLGAMPTF